MNKILIGFFSLLLLISGCSTDVIKYSINGSITGAAGKYVKIIDMTKPGLVPDSILLDMGGKFSFEKISDQPGDYIFYFKNSDYIRVTPLPAETLKIQAHINNLIESHEISGSDESEKVSQIIKRHHKSIALIDSLNQVYMKNQTAPDLDLILKRLTFIRDSIFEYEKKYLEKYIENNPNLLASYVALSQKLGPNKNLFTLNNDLKYFKWVNDELKIRFGNIDIVKMLNSYIAQGKNKIEPNTEYNSTSLIGKEAPSISLPNVYGDTLTLASLRGRYVLLDFWGSWCRPCRLENPNLNFLYKTYKTKGFEVFQVAIELKKDDWKNTIREDKISWKYQVGELNYMESETAKIYQVKALPANYLISPEGIIIAQNLFGEGLQEKLKEIFTPKTLPIIQNEQ